MEAEVHANFSELGPHPLSPGEQILFRLQQDLGFLYDFVFNLPIGCDRGFDLFEGIDRGLAWIRPDLAHREAKYAIEIDGLQHRLTGASYDDEERDALLIGEGWEVLRVPSYEIYDASRLADVLDRIEHGVFEALVKQDLESGVHPSHCRSYPVGVRCSWCGGYRPGHAVGVDHLCLDCLAPLSNGPYRPPLFECQVCGRQMVGANDINDWLMQGERPVWFECPGQHLQSDDY